MAFNISEFSARINGFGLAKNNLFLMQLTVPSNISGIAEEIGLDNLQFLCKSVQIPELQIQTTQFKQGGYGVAQPKATDFQFTPLSAVFMVDKNFHVVRFFNRWMQSVVNYDVSGGGQSQSASGLEAHHFAFKDEYIGTARVIMYSGHSTNETYVYNFSGVFPTSVGGLAPSWENGAEVMNMNVALSYDYMTVDETTTNQPIDIPDELQSQLQIS